MKVAEEAASKASSIRLVIFDVDGTLTDGKIYMGGGNMFGNMFGAANKSTTETPEPSELDKINAKVDTLTDNVNALVSALASNIKSQTKEEA